MAGADPGAMVTKPWEMAAANSIANAVGALRAGLVENNMCWLLPRRHWQHASLTLLRARGELGPPWLAPKRVGLSKCGLGILPIQFRPNARPPHPHPPHPMT